MPRFQLLSDGQWPLIADLLPARVDKRFDDRGARRHRCAARQQRGNLVLQDDQANQVDSVTYSAADATGRGPLRALS
jgi:hypothetical protein